jgi:ATP-binding cassette subfamily B multidrug efflux pump
LLKEYRTLFRYMKPYRWWYIAGVVSLVITNGFQLLIPQFIRQVIDTLTQPEFTLAGIGRIALLMLATAAAVGIGRLGWRYFLGTTARRIEAEIRDDLFTHLMTLDSRFYQNNSIGDLMARATNDMRTIRMASSMALVAAFDGLFITVFVLIILFAQNARLAAFTVIPLPAITVLLIFFGRIVGPQFRKVQEGFSSLSDHSQETFAGIRVIKSFVKEPFFLKRFSKLNDDYRQRNMRLVATHGILFPVVMFLSGLTMMILLLVGGRLALLYQLTPGELVATLSYLQMLIWPMLGAGFTVNLIQRGAASLGRINRIMEYRPIVQNPVDGYRGELSGDIKLESVSLDIGDASILKDITFTIRRGTLLGITGPVGGGKTTLLNTLPRISEISNGRISFDGREIHEIDLVRLRSQFGYVPQRSFLFSASIRDNIAFGTDTLTEDDIQRLVKAASLEQDFKLFPQGWETVVGERGITISGGQKQRVSIARALAIEPPVLLLDDPLSAVDADTEERILQEILSDIKGRTALIVSHRISTLKHCDDIIVLENGRITQQGHHDSLKDQEGYYQNIFHIQQVEAESLGGVQ